MLGDINDIYEWKDVIYTLYQSPQTREEIVDFVRENKISVVTMPEISVNDIFIDELLKEDVYVYVHTINEERIAQGYFNRGVWGGYTDVLSKE